jgi:hypothetical protein
MLTAGRCAHAKEPFDRFDAEVQIRRRVHEVIDRGVDDTPPDR